MNYCKESITNSCSLLQVLRDHLVDHQILDNSVEFEVKSYVFSVFLLHSQLSPVVMLPNITK
jgi:hypothetical protein